MLVLCETRDSVATLTLNRPARRNALSPPLIEALIEALAAVKRDDAARIVVITGAGDKAFCAGGDLGGPPPAKGLIGLHEARGRFIDLIEALFDLGKPTIARVNGAALGGGFGLTLACDLVVASERATFGMPEIKVGLFPLMIMTLVFRNLGRKKGTELMLTGDRIDAAAAERLGFVNRLVAPEALDEAVAELAGRIAGYSPAVLKLGRDAIYDTMDMPIGPALRHLCGQLTINTLLEDAAEGIGAFLQKRSPSWKGR